MSINSKHQAHQFEYKQKDIYIHYSKIKKKISMIHLRLLFKSNQLVF